MKRWRFSVIVITLTHSQMHEGLNQNLIRLWEYLMLTDRERADRLLQVKETSKFICFHNCLL